MEAKATLERSNVLDDSGRVRLEYLRMETHETVPNGAYVVLRDDGKKLLEITYTDGIPHGPFTDYWSNGVLASIGQFAAGKQEGLWQFYNRDGKPTEVIEFKDGIEVPKYSPNP